jgi:DNA-directed RNA polymerase subunit H (RpoH/RPB5)
MALQNSSSIISSVYKSRKNLISLMENLGYNVKDYESFSINEINSMFQNKQLDMLLEKNVSPQQKKIYIRYYLTKAIRPQNIQEMIDDLFNLEEVLTKEDILYIVTKEDVNDTLMNYLKHIWESEGIFIIIQNIKRLQFNILEHTLVPKHRVMNDEEISSVKIKYNISDNQQFPNISRFDPVAQAICIRPGEICEIIRPSKTAIQTPYYRICI